MKRTTKQIRRRPTRRARATNRRRPQNRKKTTITKLAEKASFALNRFVKAL